MNEPAASILACPTCRQPLSLIGTSFQCAQKHNFDLAKQGYVNLLLAHQKNSLQPGDSKAMVASRLGFLNKQYYAPIAQQLGTAIAQQFALDDGKTIHVADVGCGVGFYMKHLKRQLEGYPLECWGLDISKEAILLAAGSTKQVHWIVGSSKILPFLSHACDVIVSVFSPIDCEEILRVLKPGGLLAVVTPAKDHLLQLRQILFDDVLEIEPDRVLSKTSNDFELTRTMSIQYPLELSDKTDIHDILTMTPYLWNSKPQKQEELGRREHLTLTVDVTLWLFTPKTVA